MLIKDDSTMKGEKMEVARSGEYIKEDITEMGTKTEAIKIVVRFADGRILKGYTQNFSPNKPVFRVFSSDREQNKTLVLCKLNS